jgi:hypothetical protein
MVTWRGRRRRPYHTRLYFVYVNRKEDRTDAHAAGALSGGAQQAQTAADDVANEQYGDAADALQEAALLQ